MSKIETVPEMARLAAINTRPPKHMRGNGKPGQKFNDASFVMLCEEYDIDPAVAALMVLRNPDRVKDLTTKEQLDIYIKLMEYAYAKRKSVEHSGSINLGLSELLAEAEEEWQSPKSKDS